MLDTVPTETTPHLDNPSIKPERSPVRLIFRGVVLAAFVLFVAEVLRIFVGANFHAVVPERCYRSAQPTPHSIEAAHRKHGIRSIINLRGDNPEMAWFRDEKQTADSLGIQLFDAGLWSGEHSPTDDFIQFVRAVRDAEEPILIHCANGNDRSSLGSAVYLLLRTDASIADARGQFSLRFGHIPWSKAACLQRILDNYEGWLQAQGAPHSPDNFYYWATNIYQPEAAH